MGVGVSAGVGAGVGAGVDAGVVGLDQWFPTFFIT